jgi:hypothetical protein
VKDLEHVNIYSSNMADVGEWLHKYWFADKKRLRRFADVPFLSSFLTSDVGKQSHYILDDFQILKAVVKKNS